ncbi:MULTISPECIES: iron-containing alcohol dehydrogenase [Desulfosediminicola]|uniref:iron-containing alcohol dehydrogenase n=1 Tax=Desulfosediminicola TaxID=2886823 RepID=UPI0010ACB8CC|nr:iron-containing alcohol dehydrogenase [Desulfosediminicola ganghwensis]
MIPSYYEFSNPVKIVSGQRALENIPSELKNFGVQRPLVITDQGVAGAGLVKKLIKAFYSSEVTIGAIYDTVPADSSSLVVNEIAVIFAENCCDSIIAIGGGSPIDTAKGVNILVSEGSDDLMKFMGVDILEKPMKPLLVIPTTSGTGSEVTQVAVISDPERNVKMAFASRRLLPNVAILDPRMTLTMPPKITAATGMDALAHAMEAYTGLQKNPLSDAYAVAAIKLVGEHLLSVVQDGTGRESRMAMANAATMAGISFSNSMVGVVHALGHAAGGVAHIPHGQAMSIFLPLGLEYNLSVNEDLIAELLLPLAGPELYAGTHSDERAFKTISVIRDLQRSLYKCCQLPMNLRDAGVAEHQLGEIARAAISDGSVTFNTRELEYEDALNILKKAY